MARIQELSSGQAPSLLDARKGNELIKSINGLLESRSSQKAEIAGITLRVLDSGKIELDVSQTVIDMLTPSEEDEHSCFSDNTHRDILTNYQGFRNVLTSTYNGQKYGPAMLDKVDGETKARVMKLMASIEAKINLVDEMAKTKEHFDYQIQPGNPQAKVIVKLKNEMRKLGDEMVNVAKANGIDLTVDDVTDAEETKI